LQSKSHGTAIPRLFLIPIALSAPRDTLLKSINGGSALPKIVMIGAGSVVFSKNLTTDILSSPALRDCTLCYMDIDPDRLAVGVAICRKVAAALQANPKIECTQDLKSALAGADFVINMSQIGGFDSTLIDFEICRKYGLRFTIADTTGPGGIFRALRTFPMLQSLCRAMLEICPQAWLLNYSNPLSMNMRTIDHAGQSRAVGLCHSVQGTFAQLMGYLEEDPSQVDFLCAGINHMAFYLKLQKAGVDLYPRLFAAMERFDIYNTNRVRFELMKRLGYFVTESSEHNAEYSSWFIPHGQQVIEEFAIPIDEYLRRCEGNIAEFNRLKEHSQSDAPVSIYRSGEYGATIIDAMVTNRPTLVYGNMPNRGAIANLPAETIAEAPTPVDSTGPRFAPVGNLPPQLIGYIQPHVIQHELFLRAAAEGRRDHVYQAVMFDPLTAATLTLDKIVELCDELIAAHGNCLPRLDAPTLVPTSGKKFPKLEMEDCRKSWETAKKQ
jgi:alpha-galactosidase